MSGWLRGAALAIAVLGGSAVLFLLLLDNIVLPRIVEVPMVTVPDVSGRTREAARQQVARKGLRLAVRDSVYSDHQQPGEIVDQLPEPGERIKRARRVFVDVSRGRRLYRVPDITGGSLREAQLQLASLQLHVGRVRYSSSPTIPASVVAGQHPAAGERVPRGTPIDLRVSSGSPFADKTVPDLVGLTIGVVEDTLQKYEMDLGRVRDRVAELVPAGQVLAQEPAGGARAPRGTAVDVTVSVRRAAGPEPDTKGP